MKTESIENLKMSVEDNNWFLPTKKINYCPMCRTKTSRKLAEDGRNLDEKEDKQ